MRNDNKCDIYRKMQSKCAVPATTRTNATDVLHGQEEQQQRETQIPLSEHSSLIRSGAHHVYIVQNEAPVCHQPITGRYLHTFSYHGKYGTNTALGLTDDLVWQLNKIFTSEHKLKGFQRDIEALIRKKSELEALACCPRQEASVSSGGDQRSLTLNNPDEIAQMLERIIDEVVFLEGQYQQVEKELEMVKSLMFQELEEVFGRSKLITQSSEEVQDCCQDDNHESVQSDVSYPVVNYQSESHIETSLQTSSVVAKQRLIKERNAIQEVIYERRLGVQRAQEILHNWENYHDQEYAKFCAWQEENPDTTRTVFDVTILQEAQMATRNLIDAEGNLKEAIAHAKELGVMFDEIDQESQFPDHLDDGYRLSWEAQMTGHVDRSRIERWMKKADSVEEKLDLPPQCDDWFFNDVDISDSISMVAEGKERECIDRWQLMCNIMKYEISK